MNNIKPLDQESSTGAEAPNHTVKVQNKLETGCSIFDRLLDFAVSVTALSFKIGQRFREAVYFIGKMPNFVHSDAEAPPSVFLYHNNKIF